MYTEREVQRAARLLAVMADRRRRGVAIPDGVVSLLDELERMVGEVRAFLDDPALREATR